MADSIILATFREHDATTWTWKPRVDLEGATQPGAKLWGKIGK
jgi:hypothetical protein